MAINDIYCIRNNNRLNQGDILEGLSIVSAVFQAGDVIETRVTFPYIIVMTQDCDLEQDYRSREKEDAKEEEDKFLQSILVCPAFVAEDLKEGNHLSEFGLKPLSIPSERYRLVRSNQIKRHHFLEESLRYKMPDLIVDFKIYYTVPRDKIYEKSKEKNKVSIRNLFREDLSQRFSYYLSRIGLPVISK